MIKIYKLKPNIPDPISYLKALGNDWKKIPTHFWSDEFNDDEWALSGTEGNHGQLCKQCKEAVNDMSKMCELGVDLQKHHHEKFADLDVKKQKIPSLKKCPGIVDYLQTGVILPAWDDLHFENTTLKSSEGDKQTLFATDSNGKAVGTAHVPPQVDPKKMGFDVSHNISVKLGFPYRVRTNEDYYTLIKYPWWLGESCYTVVEGITASGFYGILNVNTLWNIEPGMKVVIPKGEPFIHLIPVPTSAVKEKFEIVQYEDMSDEDWKNMQKEEFDILRHNAYKKLQ